MAILCWVRLCCSSSFLAGKDFLILNYFKYICCGSINFYPWFKFYFPLFLGMVMYDNEFETKENKI